MLIQDVMIGLWVALINPALIGILYCRCIKILPSSISVAIGKGFIFGILFFAIICWLIVQLDIHATRLTLISLELMVTLSCVLFLFRGRRFTELSDIQLFTHISNWKWPSVAGIAMALGLPLLVANLLTQPLYPWDAWMNWVPKAIYWYDLGTDVKFVSANDWLTLENAERSFTLGNRSANRYPELIPSLQYGSMVAYGTSHTKLIFLPWLLLPFAMSCCLYEHLRQQKLPILPSIVASYMLFSLPLLRNHSVLSGYADLFLTCFFLMLVIALRNWAIHRRKVALHNLLLFGFACCLTKIPGVLLVLAVSCSLILVECSKKFRAGGPLLLTSCLLSLYVLSYVGVSANIPVIGDLVLTSNYISLPWFGSFDIAYRSIASSLGMSLFWQDNWFFLGYVFIVYVVTQVFIFRSKFIIAPELYVILVMSIFVYFIYFFTSHYKSAINFTSINRAVLYIMPILLLYIFTSVSSLMARINSRPSGIQNINDRE